MSESSVGYVANIKIEKITKRVNEDRGSAKYKTVSRDVVETVNLTIKAESFIRLQEKISAHVSLLDEEDI